MALKGDRTKSEPFDAIEIRTTETATVLDGGRTLIAKLRTRNGQEMSLALPYRQARGLFVGLVAALAKAAERQDKMVERLRLARIPYDGIAETAVEVQGRAISEREWLSPEEHRNPALVKAMRRDGIVLWDLGDTRPARQGLDIR